MVLGWWMVSLLAAPAAVSEIKPAEVLARLRTAIAAKDIDATEAACNDAARIGGELYPGGPQYPTQDGPAGLMRREKLEFRLGVVDRLAYGLGAEVWRNERYSLNVWAPGIPLPGMDPKEVKDPEVRREYERRIAENERKANNDRRHILLEDLKANWTRCTEYLVSRYYRKDPADLAELKDALSSAVNVKALRSDLEKRFEDAAKRAAR